MSKDDYSHKECEEKREKIYEKFDDHTEKLNGHTKTLGEINGGVKVLVVMLPIVGALIMMIVAIFGWVAKDQLDQLRQYQHESVIGSADTVPEEFDEDAFKVETVEPPTEHTAENPAE